MISFSALMNGESIEEQKVENQEVVGEEDGASDEDCPPILESKRAEILQAIELWRPRFVASFEGMTFEGAAIKIEVPTQELEEEIQRAKIELLQKVLTITQLRNKLELQITINEKIRASRPIRIEDKIAHINSINPKVEELRKRLDMTLD